MKSRLEKNIGYLVWTKIPTEYLFEDNLSALLERDLSQETDTYLIKLHLVKCTVQETVDALQKRGINRIRTGVSWAEWHMAQGPVWITWYLKEYARHLHILPCLTFTPPDLGVERRINVPP